ncbi:hypothetical protein CHLRE_03g212193v5 [Chlamydomonas reinhardtii]|uniref:Uncharacterized protein n=1 Tax=Chlamydomonas reinhardtii TaxID=3055 RepID=A0A2K3DZY4_CHLRE|nr:uncharacterized protein CHLRE_03g212193v5 [Chlamydomonas reinhardtii]PNW86081.1 hypothetical protein CHLRE_03g212193v5 [Chlamydomonas reinhardtii]
MSGDIKIGALVTQHWSTDTLPASLGENLFISSAPNPFASHVLAPLAPRLGKGKDGPEPWK